ncbi:MAG: RNA polymerase sigma factor [Caldanaerobacter sp.]
MGNDYEIWEKFKIGDKSALSYIYFQNFELMFQYGIKFKDDSDFVKDCIQDVFFKLIQAGTKLGSTDNIRFYLFKALKNVIIKELDKNRKIESVKTEELYFHTSFLWEEQAFENEKKSLKEKALSKALHSLSKRQQEIIYLRYDNGMSYEQISEIMQIKNDSARKLVFRAIQSLRMILEEQLRSSVLFLIHLSKKHVF